MGIEGRRPQGQGASVRCFVAPLGQRTNSQHSCRVLPPHADGGDSVRCGTLAVTSPSPHLAAYTPCSLQPDFKRRLAVDVSMAALLGEGVYSFGQLLQHPIVGSLDGTPQQVGAVAVAEAVTTGLTRWQMLAPVLLCLAIQSSSFVRFKLCPRFLMPHDAQWLHEMLEAFNNGDIHAYDALCAKYATQVGGRPCAHQLVRVYAGTRADPRVGGDVNTPSFQASCLTIVIWSLQQQYKEKQPHSAWVLASLRCTTALQRLGRHSSAITAVKLLPCRIHDIGPPPNTAERPAGAGGARAAAAREDHHHVAA